MGEGVAAGDPATRNATGGFVGEADATGMDLRGVPMMLLDRLSTPGESARGGERGDGVEGGVRIR